MIGTILCGIIFSILSYLTLVYLLMAIKQFQLQKSLVVNHFMFTQLEEKNDEFRDYVRNVRTEQSMIFQSNPSKDKEKLTPNKKNSTFLKSQDIEAHNIQIEEEVQLPSTCSYFFNKICSNYFYWYAVFKKDDSFPRMRLPKQTIIMQMTLFYFALFISLISYYSNNESIMNQENVLRVDLVFVLIYIFIGLLLNKVLVIYQHKHFISNQTYENVDLEQLEQENAGRNPDDDIKVLTKIQEASNDICLNLAFLFVTIIAVTAFTLGIFNILNGSDETFINVVKHFLISSCLELLCRGLICYFIFAYWVFKLQNDDIDLPKMISNEIMIEYTEIEMVKDANLFGGFNQEKIHKDFTKEVHQLRVDLAQETNRYLQEQKVNAEKKNLEKLQKKQEESLKKKEQKELKKQEQQKKTEQQKIEEKMKKDEKIQEDKKKEDKKKEDKKKEDKKKEDIKKEDIKKEDIKKEDIKKEDKKKVDKKDKLDLKQESAEPLRQKIGISSGQKPKNLISNFENLLSKVPVVKDQYNIRKKSVLELSQMNSSKGQNDQDNNKLNETIASAANLNDSTVQMQTDTNQYEIKKRDKYNIKEKFINMMKSQEVGKDVTNIDTNIQDINFEQSLDINKFILQPEVQKEKIKQELMISPSKKTALIGVKIIKKSKENKQQDDDPDNIVSKQWKEKFDAESYKRRQKEIEELKKQDELIKQEEIKAKQIEQILSQSKSKRKKFNIDL